MYNKISNLPVFFGLLIAVDVEFEKCSYTKITHIYNLSAIHMLHKHLGINQTSIQFEMGEIQITLG
jgi:hypothetical protein